MIINKTEDIKSFNLFKYTVERWHNYSSNSDTTYLEICIKQFEFYSEDVDLDYFDDNFSEIKNMNSEDFLGWLLNKSEEEGFMLTDFLEMESDITLEFIDEKLYNEQTNKEIIDSSKLFDAEDFELTNSQPSTDEEFYLSLDNAKIGVCNDYPFYKA
ncbi:hypothetical protein N9I95_02025 [Flavobacteriaceae bacterium]|nr:hypothetical protein [Flavobacteriaceae bacterium]